MISDAADTDTDLQGFHPCIVLFFCFWDGFIFLLQITELLQGCFPFFPTIQRILSDQFQNGIYSLHGDLIQRAFEDISVISQYPFDRSDGISAAVDEFIR